MRNYTSEILIYANNSAAALYLYNRTTTDRNVTLAILTRPYDNPIMNLLRNSSSTEQFTFINSSGFTTTYYQLHSNSTELYVFQSSGVYEISPGSYTEIKEYVIMPQGVFSAIRVNSCQPIDWHSYLLNVFNPVAYNPVEMAQINGRYCVYSSLV